MYLKSSTYEGVMVMVKFEADQNLFLLFQFSVFSIIFSYKLLVIIT